MGRRGSSQGEFAKEHSFEEKYVKPIAQSCIDANKIKLKNPTSRKSSKEQQANRQYSVHSRDSLNSREELKRGSLSSSQMEMTNGKVRRTFHVSSSRLNPQLNTLQSSDVNNDHTFRNQFSMFDEVVETLGRPDSRIRKFSWKMPSQTIRVIESNRSHSMVDTQTLPSRRDGRKNSESIQKDDQNLTMPKIAAKHTPTSSNQIHKAVTTMKAITRPIFQPQRNSDRPDPNHQTIKEYKAGEETTPNVTGGMSAFKIKLAQTKSRKIPTLLNRVEIDQSSHHIEASGNTQSLSVEKQNSAEMHNGYINQIAQQ